MQLREYIHHLEQIEREHGGDIEVHGYTYDASRIPAGQPMVAYKRILKGRESKERFWASYDPEELKGAVVVKV